jgi:hypothetical protein
MAHFRFPSFIGTEELRYPLNKKLLRLSRRDFFFLFSACEGVAVPGSVGSAKTSTTLRMWTQAYLEGSTAMGALAMGPKADFADFMREVLTDSGALDRAIFVREGENGIDLIGAESEFFGSGNGLEENITDLLFSGTEVITRTHGVSSDPFWPLSARELCKHMCVVDLKDKGKVDVKRLMTLMKSLPRKPEDLAGDWPEDACLPALERVLAKFPYGTSNSIDMAADYIRKTAPWLGEKTLSSIQISLEVVLDPYCRDTVYNAVCRDSGSWKLGDIREQGLVVVCDFPSKGGYDVTGKVIGASLKRAVEKQIERELKFYPGAKRGDMRPVAFILDDAGAYANSDDVEFLQTSRESRACAIFAFQSLALLRDQFGGTDSALNKAKTMLGFFRTVVAHENDDEETNRYYSGKRGERLERREGGSEGESGQDRRGRSQFSTNTNYQFVPAPDLPHWAYTTLKRGGIESSGEANAIITMPGKFRATGRRWLKIRLFQKPRPDRSFPQSLRELYQRVLFQWNHFKRKSLFVWTDASPRVRIWTGHIGWLKLVGRTAMNRASASKLLKRWAHFWLLNREVAAQKEAQDDASS